MSFKSRSVTSTALSAVAISAVALALATPVSAQVALEEIVVTARKREERLQEIPIAISAFSADQIQRAGITKLEDLTLKVAGVQFHSLGLAIPGRVNSSIRFRGMDVNSQVPTFQLGTLFVDGIYVLGGTHSIPLDDVERVEVVKGPQSAYFGRNTFGGAINYIMKTPSTQELTGEVNASAATYDDFDVSAAIDGPLVQDKLGVRLGGRLYSKGNMWTASDGGALGEESSKSLQGTLYATPTDNLSIKLRAFYDHDADGPPAGGAIPGRLNDTCTGLTLTTKTGQTIRPVRFPCGKVPEQGTAISALNTTKIIDSNTSARSVVGFVNSGDPDWLMKNIIQRSQPAALAGKVPTLEGIELERNIERYSGNMQYEFDGGMTATVQGGYNKQAASWVRDFAFTALDNGYSRDPQYMKDYSVEARLASAQDQRFKWLGGVNYYEQDLITAASGGDSAFACVDSIAGLPIGSCVPGRTLIFANTLGNTDHVETLGLFAGLSYDITDELSLNLEGRYQDDKFTRGITTRTTAEFKTWLPRAILQYKPTPETNIYASYAKGVIPGEINQAVIDNQNDARVLAQFTAGGVQPFLPEELLNSYEMGWKQELFDKRLSFSSAAYYGTWANKKSRIVLPINFTCGSSLAPVGNSGCNVATGGSPAGQPARNPDGTPFIQNTNVVVSGDSKIWGFEFETNAALAEGWTAGGTLDYAGNKFTSFTANFITGYAGYNNVKGNSHARFPKWSGSLNTAYTASLNDTWDWFVRADASYFGKTWVDVDNLAYCDDYWLANTRAGVEKEGLRVELFIKNVFNDDSWAACSRFSEFDLPNDGTTSTLYQSIIVAPQNKRQIGLKTAIKF
ncbi:MAG: TonB-dependent receptor [Rhodospirillaceae bacterium]|nr:TonB-dependent receptor [Rhodospirillaceae bacterium]